ncbi:MAG: pyridoxal phosphate-dependent aminotransferase [Bdellovibrionota bacterium]|jgi:alanine-synthesizing transaminase
MGFLADNSLSLNAIEIARRKRRSAGLPLLDLTESNPTKCGLFFPPEILRSAADHYIDSRVYCPDPKGLETTRSAIATYYASRTPPLNISADHIIVTASTSEAYRFLFSVLCEPYDNLLAPDITYPLFEFFAEDQRIDLHNYRLIEARNWEIEVTSIDIALDKRSRAILLVSPHNPTGKIQRRRLSVLAETELPIIVDEVFADFVHDEEPCPPLGTLYQDTPVFHLNGISKMFALPDFKIGWIAMDDKAYQMFGEKLEFLNDTYLNASSLSQSVIPRLFQEGHTFQKEMLARIKENVSFVKGSLERLGFPPINSNGGGTFLLVSLPDGLDEEEFVIRLINAGVFLHPGYFYNVTGNHLMISCLPPKEKLEEGLSIIKNHI